MHSISKLDTSSYSSSEHVHRVLAAVQAFATVSDRKMPIDTHGFLDVCFISVAPFVWTGLPFQARHLPARVQQLPPAPASAKCSITTFFGLC